MKSGRYFGFMPLYIETIADDIETMIWQNDNEEPDEDNFNFSPETIAEFKKAVCALRLAYIYAERIDRLAVYAETQGAFHARLKQKLIEHEEQRVPKP
jgi:hypothetical protein